VLGDPPRVVAQVLGDVRDLRQRVDGEELVWTLARLDRETDANLIADRSGRR
jgi:hypothetical protein